MRRRTMIIPLLLIFATAIGLSLRNYHPEPEYQNHPLSYWLDYNPREENEGRDEWRYRAIEAIGTNALPIYAAWLHVEDPFPKSQLIKLLAYVNIHILSASEHHNRAIFGWRAGELSHKLVNPIIWEEFSRYDIPPSGSTTLDEEQIYINCLVHGNADVREKAAFRMPRYSYSPESIKALTSALKDPSLRVRYFTARSLALSGEKGQPAIPALIESLQDTNEFVRMTAAFALGKFGKAGASARPAILPLLKDPNTDVRACAKLALQQIDADAIVIQAKK